jgi:hypothetical protein
MAIFLRIKKHPRMPPQMATKEPVAMMIKESMLFWLRRLIDVGLFLIEAW